MIIMIKKEEVMIWMEVNWREVSVLRICCGSDLKSLKAIVAIMGVRMNVRKLLMKYW